MEPVVVLHRPVTDTGAAREVLRAAPTCWGPAIIDQRPGWWRLGIDGDVVSVQVEPAVDTPRRLVRHLRVPPDRSRGWSVFTGSLTLHVSDSPVRASSKWLAPSSRHDGS